MTTEHASGRTFSLPARDLPRGAGIDREIIAIGDVHGQAEALAACLDQITGIPRLPDRGRALVFLGDLIDRGPDSLGALHLALGAKEATNADHVVFLPGNHELMLLDVLDGGDPEPWLCNGGEAMLREIDLGWRDRPWPDVLGQLSAGLPAGFEALLRDAPSHHREGSLVFVHAGLDPEAEDEVHLARARPMDERHWATIRHPFLTWTGGWDIDQAMGHRRRGPTVVVHGHTPAVRSDLEGVTEEMAQMDGVDGYRAVCLDAGALSRPQVGWARFRPDRDGTVMQVHVTVAGPRDSRGGLVA